MENLSPNTRESTTHLRRYRCLPRPRRQRKLDERSHARGPVDHADVALDAVAHKIGVRDDEGALVAKPYPAADLWQRRHCLALQKRRSRRWGEILLTYCTPSFFGGTRRETGIRLFIENKRKTPNGALDQRGFLLALSRTAPQPKKENKYDVGP